MLIQNLSRPITVFDANGKPRRARVLGVRDVKTPHVMVEGPAGGLVARSLDHLVEAVVLQVWDESGETHDIDASKPDAGVTVQYLRELIDAEQRV